MPRRFTSSTRPLQSSSVTGDRPDVVSRAGGGRYLFDTVKGSDLGFDRTRSEIVLDFNFAYNPSCSYDPRWACPLASQANVLPIEIAAGEKDRSAAGSDRF
jgi:uncharacterized protein (DUF1684 family)